MAGAADVFLVIEVADSSVRYGETVNRLSGGQRCGEPGRHGAGERVALAAAPGIVVPLDRLFG